QSLRDLEDPDLPRQLDLYDPHHLMLVRSPGPTGSGPNEWPACGARRTGADRRKLVFKWQQAQGEQSGRPVPEERRAAASVDRSLVTLRQRYNDAVKALSA